MYPALITALLAAFASIAAISFTKQKEREAIWTTKKLAYYEEFFGAASGIVAKSAPTEAKIRFATAVNNLHLIGSGGIIQALHAFCDEIAESNRDHADDRHDALWSRLVWEIRADLGARPSKSPEPFRARLWASGVQGRNP